MKAASSLLLLVASGLAIAQNNTRGLIGNGK